MALIAQKNVRLKDGRSLLLRAPEKEDAAACIQYLKQVGGETDFLLADENGIPGLTEESEKAYLQSVADQPRAAMILALCDGEIVGISEVRASGHPRMFHNAGLAISIKKAYWGLGIGSLLMQEMIDFAIATQGVTRLRIEVFADNARAIGLYKKFGFTECGSRHDYFSVRETYHDELLLEKSL